MTQISTQAALEEALKADAVIIDFWAPWCGPCKMLMPRLDAMAQANPKLSLVKVNIDEAPEIAGAFRIRSIPTLVAYHKGQFVRSMGGNVDAEHLTELTQLALTGDAT